MGFRSGAWAKLWEVESLSDTTAKGRISISRKDKSTGEYIDDFSDYVTFRGSGAARKALCLETGAKFRLGDIDVSRKYVKEKNRAYYDFKIFSFETSDEVDTGQKIEKQFASQGVASSEDTDDLPF